MIKIIMMLLMLTTALSSGWAGLEHTAIVDGVIQSWDETTVELLSHDKLVLVPKTAFKGPLVENKRVRLHVPVDQLRPSPNERIRQIKKRNENRSLPRN